MPLSLATTGSSKLRPIRRLMAKKVLAGLVTAWRLAGWPTRRSPSSWMATTDGVVRAPSAFSITLGCLPSMMATHELVVPRSMPMILLMGPVVTPLAGGFGGLGLRAPRGSVPRFPRFQTDASLLQTAERRAGVDMGNRWAAARGTALLRAGLSQPGRERRARTRCRASVCAGARRKRRFGRHVGVKRLSSQPVRPPRPFPAIQREPYRPDGRLPLLSPRPGHGRTGRARGRGAGPGRDRAVLRSRDARRQAVLRAHDQSRAAGLGV